MYPKQVEAQQANFAPSAPGLDPSGGAGAYYPQHQLQPAVIMQQPQPVMMGSGPGLLGSVGGGLLSKLANKVNPGAFADSGIRGAAGLAATLGGGGADEALPPMMPPPPRYGVPLGLEILADLEEIVIKQKAEFLEVMSGFETANRYNVLNPITGQRIYFAGETTDAASLCCGGVQRPFSITVVDFSGRAVLLLERPCDPVLYCTSVCPVFGSIGGKVTVKLATDGSLLGEIVHSFACYQLQYSILDGSQQKIMTVSGPLCGDCCMCTWCTCGSSTFPVHTAGSGTGGKDSAPAPVHLGNIKKRFSGFREIMTDADTFGVNFPRDLDVRWKALMFAAVFLIDFMYFEQSASKTGAAAAGGGVGGRLGMGGGLPGLG